MQRRYKQQVWRKWGSVCPHFSPLISGHPAKDGTPRDRRAGPVDPEDQADLHAVEQGARAAEEVPARRC